MAIEVKVPAFPESISEGTVATWHKGIGDSVTEGETLVEIETDKVVMEVPATATGVLTSISKKEGDTVTSQEVIGSIDAGAKATAAPVAAAQPAAAQAATPVQAQATSASQEAGPSARRALAEHDLKAQDIKGSGKDGRLTKQDVDKHVQFPASSVVSNGARSEQRVPMSRLRATIAKRLVEVQSTAAILTTFNEVDMKAVMDLRTQYKDIFEKDHGVKLGFMSFFLKATVEALKKFPAVNASIDGNDIVYHGYYDVGVAVSSPRGLVVPVVRNVDQMSLADIEKSIKEFGGKAKDGKLSIEDMQGGTFTVTNGGVFGSMLSTPIINQPQSAILGMHNIVERAVVVKGEIVIRPIMYLALSYDHRIVDGRESVSFLKTIKELIEDPARMLLGV
ncbi:MAG: 2-oxoglutarate dehydrogenase complex dihydrolipoyllysine-residue succinyltransferase [Gammaproteobacteria bacterium]|nr:2-oxoglutarate dehydrogenase complex dihydrolipoyllysine-residue succinyltransferase [Gammaproteobacteria bacterium]